MGYRRGKRFIKNGMGCSDGESGVSVENTKLLSEGEQMSDCHCACIFLSNTGLGEAHRQWAPCGCRNKARSAICQISWQQIDLNFKARPTSRRQS